MKRIQGRAWFYPFTETDFFRWWKFLYFKSDWCRHLRRKDVLYCMSASYYIWWKILKTSLYFTTTRKNQKESKPVMMHLHRLNFCLFFTPNCCMVCYKAHESYGIQLGYYNVDSSTSALDFYRIKESHSGLKRHEGE